MLLILLVWPLPHVAASRFQHLPNAGRITALAVEAPGNTLAVRVPVETGPCSGFFVQILTILQKSL